MDGFSLIELGKDSGETLLCPLCGSDLLHHMEITVFHRRREDVPDVRVTVVHGESVTSSIRKSAEANNPSRRRDGITISFFCETCDFTGKLGIAQHKGETLIAWHENTTGIVENPLY